MDFSNWAGDLYIGKAILVDIPRTPFKDFSLTQIMDVLVPESDYVQGWFDYKK